MIGKKWCKEEKKWESRVRIYTEMEQGDVRWIVKSSVHWSGSSVYLSDNAFTNINT